MRRFGSSLTTALVSLFPELDFDVTKFGNSPRISNSLFLLNLPLFISVMYILIRIGNFWNSAHNRRALLEKFARSKGSDPLLPSFWYNLNPAELRLMKVLINFISSHLPAFNSLSSFYLLLSFQGASATFEYYEGYADTVVHLFPELHLDFSKFKQRTGIR